MGFRVWGTGWWEFASTVEKGTFTCPAEGAQRDYKVVRTSRWITLVYVPVVPLGIQSRHVKCTKCKGIYTMSVIHGRVPAGAAAPASSTPEPPPEPPPTPTPQRAAEPIRSTKALDPHDALAELEARDDPANTRTTP